MLAYGKMTKDKDGNILKVTIEVTNDSRDK